MNATTENIKTSFAFTVATWNEVTWDKTALNYTLGVFLNEKINLETFGNKVLSMRFIPIMVPAELEIIHTNDIIFHRSRNELGLYWRMDYTRVMKSTLLEFKTYLADFFLEVLEIAKNTKRIRDFDYDGFIAAVKAVLPEWLAQEPEL